MSGKGSLETCSDIGYGCFRAILTNFVLQVGVTFEGDPHSSIVDDIEGMVYRSLAYRP